MQVLSLLLGFAAGVIFTLLSAIVIIRLGIGHFRRHPELLGPQVMRPIINASKKTRLKSVG